MLSAILLGIAIVATAWCAYQSTVWGGIQTFLLRDSTSAGLQHTTLVLEQEQYVSRDSLTFMEYINSLYDNNTERSKFYYERFSPELKIAVDAWLKANPLENPNAVSHPFDMEEYERKYSKEIEQSANLVALKIKEAEQAHHNSANYVLLTVIFASVLFIDAVMDKFPSRQLRLIILILGIIIFSAATVTLFTLPVAMA